MTYQVDEEVLLCRAMGRIFTPPMPAKITRQVSSLIYGYEVSVPEVGLADVKILIKEEWCVPRHTTINEVPDTPFD